MDETESDEEFMEGMAEPDTKKIADDIALNRIEKMTRTRRYKEEQTKERCPEEGCNYTFNSKDTRLSYRVMAMHKGKMHKEPRFDGAGSLIKMDPDIPSTKTIERPKECIHCKSTIGHLRYKGNRKLRNKGIHRQYRCTECSENTYVDMDGNTIVPMTGKQKIPEQTSKHSIDLFENPTLKCSNKDCHTEFTGKWAERTLKIHLTRDHKQKKETIHVKTLPPNEGNDYETPPTFSDEQERIAIENSTKLTLDEFIDMMVYFKKLKEKYGIESLKRLIDMV